MGLNQLLIVGLSVVGLLILGFVFGWYVTKLIVNRRWERIIPELRKDAIIRSRANLGGKFAEALSMYFPDFPFSPTELRWIGGSPVDYVAFKGMDNNRIEEIVFVEIKSGKSQLSSREQHLASINELQM
ncbi:MAG: Holliday junction resolvase-like protein [Candidatus Woesearchaeota archaeon]